MIAVRKGISSPNSIKTCYIAAVKEEMGFPVRRAWNRRCAERKVKPDVFMKELIRAAIRKVGNGTYEEIQRAAFEIYRQERRGGHVMSFRGVFNDDPSEVRAVAEDHGVAYV